MIGMWSEDERAEYEAAMRDSWADGVDSATRTDAIERIITDAVQAHRPWARDLERQATRDGLYDHLKKWEKKQRTVPVVRDELVVERSTTVGVQRRDEDGVRRWTQEPLLTLTRAEVADRKVAALRQARAYTHDAAEMDRLLALFDLAPDAQTVEEALDAVGTTLGEWLGREQAA